MSNLFRVKKPLIAMIHVPALPGTPAYNGNTTAILDKVAAEAQQLRDLGVDGFLIENMHDTPYLAREVGPEIVAWMTAVGVKIKNIAPQLPCGIQILAGANQAAVAVAQAADLQFVRAEGFVFGHLADEGWMNSDAGSLLRYRQQIGAGHIPIWTDIKKKHSAHAATADISLVETAKSASFFRTDGLIVTGTATGAAADLSELMAVRSACPDLPLFVGSGVNPENARQYLAYCDGLIVGSYLKQEGHWANALDEQRIKKLLAVM